MNLLAELYWSGLTVGGPEYFGMVIVGISFLVGKRGEPECLEGQRGRQFFSQEGDQNIIYVRGCSFTGFFIGNEGPEFLPVDKGGSLGMWGTFH